MIFTDMAYHNVCHYDKTTQRMVVHPFDWGKSIAMGVQGSIIKGSEGMNQDIAYDLSMSTCPLPYRGTYGYVKYTQRAYPIGGEVAWGRKTAQFLVELSYKYDCNLRETIDAEQNAKWELLKNTDKDQALNRFLAITAAQIAEIHRLTGHAPIMYTNPWLTQFMDSDFTMCPLLIAAGTRVVPKIYNWEKADGIQFDWKGDGKMYGNFTGNASIDLNEIFDIEKFLIPGRTAFGQYMVTAEDEVITTPVKPPAKIIAKAQAWLRPPARRAWIN